VSFDFKTKSNKYPLPKSHKPKLIRYIVFRQNNFFFLIYTEIYQGMYNFSLILSVERMNDIMSWDRWIFMGMSHLRKSDSNSQNKQYLLEDHWEVMNFFFWSCTDLCCVYTYIYANVKSDSSPTAKARIDSFWKKKIRMEKFTYHYIQVYNNKCGRKKKNVNILINSSKGTNRKESRSTH